MNLYIYGIGILLICYLFFVNHSMSETIIYQENEIAGMQSSLANAKQDFSQKLQAIAIKHKSDMQTKMNIEEIRKGCEKDEKAIAIIAIGVPDCLR